jgi:hypothetical protein
VRFGTALAISSIFLVNHLTEFESDKIAHENGITAEKARPLALFSRTARCRWPCSHLSAF